MSDYRKLKVWRKAHALALSANLAANCIRGQRYASCRGQILRAAMSIPANIVEGREQKTEASFARYLRIAVGSASELEYHLIAAHEMRIISRGDYISLSGQIAEVRMMLHGLLRRLEPPARRSRARDDLLPSRDEGARSINCPLPAGGSQP